MVIFTLYIVLFFYFHTCYATVQSVGTSINNVDPNNPEFTFGKDRELFHASIDLKWLFQSVTEKKTWSSILSSIFHKIKRLSRDYDNQYTYKSIATDILSECRQFNKNSPLRALHCSLRDAHNLANNKRRLVLFYVENDSYWNHSEQTRKVRIVLSDTSLGNLINEKFFFMACGNSHPYASNILRLVAEYNVQQELISQLTNQDGRRSLIRNEGAARSLLNNELLNHQPSLPIIAILSPLPTTTSLWNLPLPGFLQKRPEFEVVGLLQLHAIDATATEISAYLRSAVYSPPSRGRPFARGECTDNTHSGV